LNLRPRNAVPAPDEPVPVLLVNFSADDEAALCEILAHPNWELHGRANGKQALAFLTGRRVPVVMVERDREGGAWKDLLNAVQEHLFPPNLIVCSHLADDWLWADVLSMGADVLVEPFDDEEVMRVAYMAWQSWKRRCSEQVRHTRMRFATAGVDGV
jgi:DNA-binding response OmpR family regulator